ncbi:hypothetical protein [Streptomyces sp. CNQ085]|uniref:hypothetical protein n=1 Tax=Streptomyces sp. CNQ085 TaxID=2886944 RepID=UPI001F50885B|nr:hypothetical protein [Streptomyces sp. CNQ085]MCI0386203.1 hypothetical protein [Streptomyces sp. CNQ085]
MTDIERMSADALALRLFTSRERVSPEDAARLLAEVKSVHRAATLHEAADAVDGAFHGEPFLNYPPDFAELLRRMADAADRDTAKGGAASA